ncbi:MAG: peptide ABC transporter substrate-binding protein [Anaerolineae bacterium]|nr:peptide ABC transporter substrate-binding protein [Anaerolineae bacterium]
MKTPKIRFLPLLAMLGVLACLCNYPLTNILTGSSSAEILNRYDIPRDNTLVLAYYEVETLDPAKWLYGAEDVVGDLYSGLVRQGASLQLVPDLAEDWDVSTDGTVYTFHLRQGVTFHDGKPFTAEDVRYSWERAVSPALGSNTALTYLNDIRGVHDVAAGHKTAISGLKVIDDYTVEVTLEAPAAYFLYKIAMPVAWIVDAETIDQIETSPNGTGPFSLIRHDVDQVFILKKNPDYYLGPVALDYVIYLLYAGYPIRLYEAGDIDIVTINEDLVARATSPSDPLYGQVQTVSTLCTDYHLFDVSQPPFDDLLVRRAFVQAIDKERYSEAILGGIGNIANGLYPPGLPGYTPDVKPMRYDAEAAVQDLRDSAYGGPEGLPQITFTTFGSGGTISSGDGMLIQLWQNTLGVSVTPEGLDYLNFYDQVYRGHHGQIINSGWCADYIDPENFAEMFHSQSPQNRGNYNNSGLDALLVKARSEPDINRRLQLYQQAQQIIVDDAVALFLSHAQPDYIVTKPYLKGYVASPIGVAQHMYLSIERDSAR